MFDRLVLMGYGAGHFANHIFFDVPQMPPTPPHSDGAGILICGAYQARNVKITLQFIPWAIGAVVNVLFHNESSLKF